MTEEEQKREEQKRALEFELTLFPNIAGAATKHFLDALDRDLQRAQEEISKAEKTDEEKLHEYTRYRMELTKNAHVLIRQHTTMIAGGFVRDMFPGVYPVPEEAKSIPLEVEPKPIVVGVTGIPSEEAMMG